MQGELPEQWRKGIIVPFYKGKGSQNDCKSYRGISLLSVPRTVYGRVLNERLMNINEGCIGTEQVGFRRGRECVDQNFCTENDGSEVCGEG